jgi:anti-sigma factor RsiW
MSLRPPCSASCAHFRLRLSELIDCELEPSDRAEVLRHLAACADCAWLEQELELLVDAIRRLGAGTGCRWPVELAAQRTAGAKDRSSGE